MSVEDCLTPKSNGIAQEPRETRELNGGGIKLFTGGPLPRHDVMVAKALGITAEELRENTDMDRRVWRPEETTEAAQPFFTHGRINVIGAPQSGKGTILYGLSEICHRLGWGYMFVDGHHQETPAETVIDAFYEAQRRNIPILYDAFDHNLGGAPANSGGVRKFNHVYQRERTTAIMQHLVRLTVPVAITNHDEEWAQAFVNLDLRRDLSPYLGQFPDYEVPLGLKSAESIKRFLLDHDVPVPFADFISHMRQNPEVYNFLSLAYGDKKVAAEVMETSTHFPILKELVRPWDPEQPIGSGRAEDVQAIYAQWGTIPLSETVAQLAEVMREADMKRVFLTALRRNKKADNRYYKKDKA